MNTIVKQVVRGMQIAFFVWMFIAAAAMTFMAFASIGIAEGFSQTQAIIYTIAMDIAYGVYVAIMWKLSKK